MRQASVDRDPRMQWDARGGGAVQAGVGQTALHVHPRDGGHESRFRQQLPERRTTGFERREHLDVRERGDQRSRGGSGALVCHEPAPGVHVQQLDRHQERPGEQTQHTLHAGERNDDARQRRDRLCFMSHDHGHSRCYFDSIRVAFLKLNTDVALVTGCL